MNSAITPLACLPKTSPAAIFVGTACPLIILTAAVFWLCKGSIITCPLIRGWNEWINVVGAVSGVNYNLIFKSKSLNNYAGREDPIDLYIETFADYWS